MLNTVAARSLMYSLNKASENENINKILTKYLTQIDIVPPVPIIVPWTFRLCQLQEIKKYIIVYN